MGMFTLHVLGTSGSRPTATRSVSGNYLMTPHGGMIIDCGEGFQERLVRQDLSLKRSKAGKRAKASKVRVILLTHCHLDHCWGLIPFLHTMNLDGRTEPLTIIAPGAPEGSDSQPDFNDLFGAWKEMIEEEYSRGRMGYEVEWVLIPIENQSPIDSPVQPFEDLHLTAVPTRHGVISVAWLVSSKKRPQRRLMVSGDTSRGVTAFNSDIIGGELDVLIHEATYSNETHDMAEVWGHSTAEDAAKAATAMQARLLGMLHLSSRISDPSVLELEAATHHNQSFVCEDGDIIEVSWSGDISVSRLQGDAWTDLSIG